MRPFLVFRLYGPMASWGEIAVGETRPSALHPTRSALLGLLAAALGLRRGDEAALSRLSGTLRFAVLVESAGVPLSDYHTAQVTPPRRGEILATRQDQLRERRDALQTILSRRDYRCDAFYTVAAWQEGENPEFELARLKAALERPVFPLYLGRKSCPPALPLSPRLLEAESLPAALGRAELPSLDAAPFDRLKRLGPVQGLFWEGDPGLGGLEAEQAFTRRDDPGSRLRWLFKNRRELFTSKVRTDGKDDRDVSEPDQPLS